MFEAATDSEREGSTKKPAILMSSGVSAGLHKGETIRKQAEEKLRIEKERLSKLDPKSLGKDEDTVFRDRRGLLIIVLYISTSFSLFF